ncbi:hypothetical protein Nepgr_003848 [Nepenthes gracilis]|uniref:Uncharacterized protein n=1 Tax=Nepenthes gracilis TaxID=150966 RepID=A0AAD3XE89_NEPGR|nr:hypothetical protein Nepgr_003848 [Nepenthes gracilis]
MKALILEDHVESDCRASLPPIDSNGIAVHLHDSRDCRCLTPTGANHDSTTRAKLNRISRAVLMVVGKFPPNCGTLLCNYSAAMVDVSSLADFIG